MSELVAARWAGLQEDLAALLVEKRLDRSLAPAIAAHLCDNREVYEQEVDAKNVGGNHTGAILEVARGKSAKALVKIAETCGAWCGYHVHNIDLGQTVRGPAGAIFIHQKWTKPPDVVTTFGGHQATPLRLTLILPPEACVAQIPDSGQVKCPCRTVLLQPLQAR